MSHASEDRLLATELRRWLDDDHHEVFLDQDLRDDVVFGDQWQCRLHERLRWADAVICVVTSAYVTSTWCAAEIGIAQSRGNRLLPVLAEPGIAHPLLISDQHADMTRDLMVARAALLERLRRVDAAGGLGWPDTWRDDHLPFPGLRPFEIDQHQVFFGRHSEVNELAELLRSPAERAERSFLLVVGPSGCGKSSLVRAGLLSTMANEDGWRPLPPIVPGDDPVGSLISSLAEEARRSGLDWTERDIQHRIDKEGLTELADQLLLAAPGGPWRRLLVVVDQFEELLTLAPPGQRARFAQLLRPALGGPVQLVGTLRSEFQDPVLNDSDLITLRQPHIYSLRTLRREALRAVIEGPARLAGITVADDLVTQLVDDTDSGEALPLLAFTLALLAEGVGRGGELSRARYEQLGRVQGALAKQADAALEAATRATDRREEEVLAGLLQLVTVDEHGSPTRWRIDRAQLPEPVNRELDVFVERRLLTTDTRTDSVVIAVAHEKFLVAWQPLARAIEENKSALRARQAIEQVAAEWAEADRPSERLWDGGNLATAKADLGARLQDHDLVTDRVKLSSNARDFLRDSIHRDRLRHWRNYVILAVLSVSAVVAAIIAYGKAHDAQRQLAVAVSRQVAAQTLELSTTKPALAAQLGLAAYRLAPTTEARGNLLSTVAIPYTTILTGHTGDVRAVAFSPDGHTLATTSADHTARLWDASKPDQSGPPVSLTGHTDTVTAVAFSPDGRTLATTSADRTARLWDIIDPRQPGLRAKLMDHANTVRAVAFSPDGRTLATASTDETARLWDVNQATVLRTLAGHTGTVSAVAFSPDGRTLATASFDNTARLWDIDHATVLRTLTGHTNGVAAVAFRPDGRVLATGSYDHTARLWDLPGPIIADHLSDVTAVAFSPDGRTLATGSYDKTARLWDISDTRQPHLLSILSGGTVNAVAFSPDGHTLATTSYDKTAQLWDISNLSNPRRLAILTGHTDYVYSVAFSPDGRTLTTASYDHTARLWDISDTRNPSPLEPALTGHTEGVFGVAFSPDGRTLATTSYDETTRLWDVSDPHHPVSLASLTGHTEAVYAVAFGPDGRTLATASADTTARLWDISDRRHPSPLAPPLTGHTSGLRSVAFSPDGRTLATGSYDKTARLWNISDLHRPSSLATLTGHTDGVLGVAFSPDQHTLATASQDRTARLWETNVDTVANRICLITPGITQREWDQYVNGVSYQPPCR